MQNKTLNAAQVWKQMEDNLVPRLRLSALDRSIYSHLLRHSRLEGKLRLRFSVQWLARAVRASGGPASGRKESLKRAYNRRLKITNSERGAPRGVPFRLGAGLLLSTLQISITPRFCS